MPKFNNEDNFIMFLKLNDDIIQNNKLVAYFLAASKAKASYSLKNKFKYKVVDEMLYAKAKSSKSMLYKESGVKIAFKKLKKTELRFRHFSIHMTTDKDEKKPGVFSKLMQSLSSSKQPSFSKVDTFNDVYEFGQEVSESKFNRTKYIDQNRIN